MDRNPPTLAGALETLAFHADVEGLEVPRGGERNGGCGLWADPNGPIDGLHVCLDYRIRGTAPEGESIWDQCYVRPHGAERWEWVGNRCGLRNAISRAYAPVIAAIAAREAADAAAAA
jgi:hypothetical protein